MKPTYYKLPWILILISQNPSTFTIPMVDVMTQIEISKPIEQVAAYACNPDHATSWYKNIKAAHWKSPKPLAVGSLIDFEAQFMGKKLAYTYEIKELSDRHLIMSTSQGPFPMTTTYRFESLANGHTRMTLRNHGSPSGFSAFMTPLMAWMMRRANNEDLRQLKAILESIPDRA
jgi:hypothetical protein